MIGRQIIDRAAIIRRAGELIDWRDIEPSRGCLLWAGAAALALCEAGERAVINAGTAMFAAVPESEDDGTADTHVSYVWDDVLGERLAAAGLAEVHVWAALPGRGEIIDLTTRYLPERAREYGLEWRTPVLEYFWGSELPERWIYHPSEVAMKWAHEGLEVLVRAGYLNLPDAVQSRRKGTG